MLIFEKRQYNNGNNGQTEKNAHWIKAIEAILKLCQYYT